MKSRGGGRAGARKQGRKSTSSDPGRSSDQRSSGERSGGQRADNRGYGRQRDEDRGQRSGGQRSGGQRSGGAGYGRQRDQEGDGQRGGQRSGRQRDDDRGQRSGGGSQRPSQGRDFSSRSDNRRQRTVVRGSDDRARRRPKSSSGLGGDQVEGRQAVRELLRAGNRKVYELLMAEDMEETAIIAEIIDLAGDRRVQVREVSDNKLLNEARSEAPQGVIAYAAPVEDVGLDDLLEIDGVPFLLVLDGLTDPGNLGALLRTAEGAGVTGIVMPKHRSVRLSPTAVKAAAGAVEHLAIAQVGGIASAMSDLRDAGVWCIGLDSDAETELFDIKVATEPIALVLGSEGSGLSQLVAKRCDQLVSIPLVGSLESLNVSVAGAVATYEIVRRRNL